MNTEQKILKLISENKRKNQPHTVAKYLKFGNSYVEYLYERLLEKGLIKKLKEKNLYKITRKGREEMGERIKHSKTMIKRKKITQKSKKKKYKREPKLEKKRIKKQRKKKIRKIIKPKAERRIRRIFKKVKRKSKSEPEIEKEEKEQLKGLIFPTTETKEKEELKNLTSPTTEMEEKEEKKERKGITEVFKKLFAKPPKGTK